MHIRRPRLLALVLGLAISTVMLAVTVQNAYVAPPFLEGEGSSFRYTGQGERNGGLYVTISVNFDDAGTLRRYVETNGQRGRDLANRGRGPLPIQLTFARPLPLGEVRDLVQETGIKVDSFAMVGRSSTSGKKGVHIEFSSVEKEMPAMIDMDPTGNGDQLALAGVMVVKGDIASPQSLTRLLADYRIYLVDTSERELRDLLAQRHANAIAGKEITVSVPSPFWRLDW